MCIRANGRIVFGIVPSGSPFHFPEALGTLLMDPRVVGTAACCIMYGVRDSDDGEPWAGRVILVFRRPVRDACMRKAPLR